MAKKKYTLYKAEGDSAPGPCAFFLSPQGCRNGDKCKFLHVLPSALSGAANAANAVSSNNSISSSDISSESEDETPPPSPQPKATPKVKATPKAKTTPKAKATPNVVAATSDDIFAAPGEVVHNTATPRGKTPKTPKTEESKKKKRKRNPEQSDPFAKPKHAAVSTPKTKADLNSYASLADTPNTATPKPKKRQKSVEKKTSFRDLDLPVACFTIPGTSAAQIAKSLPVAPAPTTTPPKPPKFPTPSATPEGIKWQKAVIATRANPRYQSDFDFDKTKSQEEEKKSGRASDWFQAQPHGPKNASNPHAIAIDCEMCETKDPVTGASNHKALCRVSIVNAVNPDEVLLDTLVKPDWPVVDYRSRINGIKKEHLESVQFTLKHAQEYMKALCSNETVIIGHAVHNDLVALKMEHHCNVDSAMLFEVKDEPNATCSLKDLAKGVLERDMPDIHDSVNDARVALFVLEEGYLKKNGSPEPVVRSFPVKRRGGSSDLFVHRIPKGCFPGHISNMLLAHTHIKPKEVQDIEFNSDTGKTTVVFASPDHANLAFKTLEGEAKPDKTGRLQKRVYLRSGGYINIRKMTGPKKREG